MSKLKKPVPLYEDIRALVLSARQTIARGVDLLQVHTNYEIGRRIVRAGAAWGKNRAEYGKELLSRLGGSTDGGVWQWVFHQQSHVHASVLCRLCRTGIPQIRPDSVWTNSERSPSPTLSGELTKPQFVQTLSGESLNPGTRNRNDAACLYTELVALRLPDRSERGRAQLL